MFIMFKRRHIIHCSARYGEIWKNSRSHSVRLNQTQLKFYQVTRRQMQVEAAERRRMEMENRGIKDPEKVRRQQQRAAKMESDEIEAAKKGFGNPALKVLDTIVSMKHCR